MARKRINLSLDQEMYDLLHTIGELTDTPKATVISNFLYDAKPLLIELKNALQLAEDKKDFIPTLAAMIGSTEEKMAEMRKYNLDMKNEK